MSSSKRKLQSANLAKMNVMEVEGSGKLDTLEVVNNNIIVTEISF